MLGSSNISVTLVRNTLGESSNSVGKLCSSDKINKWSVFKPVPRSIADINKPDWYKGNPTYNPYGLKIETWTGINPGMFKTGKWEYTKPSGGSNSIYALGDFRKYNHNARIPIQTVWPEKMYTKQPNQNRINALMVAQTDEAGGQIAIDIVKPLLNITDASASVHMGVCIVSSSGSYTWKTGNMGALTIDFSRLGSQFKSNIDVCLFLTNVTQEDWATSAQVNMMTCALPDDTTQWKHYDTLDTSEPVYEPTWDIDMDLQTFRPNNTVNVLVRFVQKDTSQWPIRIRLIVNSVISSYKTQYGLEFNQADAIGHLGKTWTMRVPIRGILLDSNGIVGSYDRAFPILVPNQVQDLANHYAPMGALKVSIDPNAEEIRP